MSLQEMGPQPPPKRPKLELVPKAEPAKGLEEENVPGKKEAVTSMSGNVSAKFMEPMKAIVTINETPQAPEEDLTAGMRANAESFKAKRGTDVPTKEARAEKAGESREGG